MKNLAKKVVTNFLKETLLCSTNSHFSKDLILLLKESLINQEIAQKQEYIKNTEMVFDRLGFGDKKELAIFNDVIKNFTDYDSIEIDKWELISDEIGKKFCEKTKILSTNGSYFSILKIYLIEAFVYQFENIKEQSIFRLENLAAESKHDKSGIFINRLEVNKCLS
jgi:hypothetical protein